MYNFASLFLIYAFLGWCTEVGYAALNHGKFVNRGFLNGPVCPIYGCGAVAVILILNPIKNNVLILFLGSFFLTSAIEWITGFVLEKIFHDKWWDYSNIPFNLNGYVCLKFSIVWGVVCVFVVSVLEPMIYRFIHFIPFYLGIILNIVFYCAFLADIIITVAELTKIRSRFKAMNEIEKKLDGLSNKIGIEISDGVLNVADKGKKLKVDLTEYLEESNDNIREKINDSQESLKKKIDELQRLYDKYKTLYEKKNFVHRRLTRSYPLYFKNRKKDIYVKFKNISERLKDR